MKKSFLYGTNTVISIVLLAAILFLINVLPTELKAVNVFGTRVPLQKKWDFTETKRFTLSPQTVKVLGSLQQPVTAIGFAKLNTADYANLEALLKQYSFESPNFKYQIEDPERNPLIAKKYGIKATRTVILTAGKGQQETVTMPAGPGAAEAQTMEAKLTAGLMHLVNPKPATVYFTSGHGEFPIEQANNPLGLTTFKTSLEGENYTVKALPLLTQKKVPEDATVVVICNISQDFLPDDLNALETYLERGGRLLVFFNASDRMQPLPRFSKFLSAHGIAPQEDLVLSRQFVQIPGSREGILIPAVEKYGTSPITDGFNTATAYPVARSFKVDKPPKDAQVTPLATTSADSYQIRRPITTDMLRTLVTKMDPAAIFDKGTDTQGEAVLAVQGVYTTAPIDVSLTPSPGASGAPSPGASGSPGAAPSPGASGSPASAPSPGASGSPASAPSPSASGSPASAPSPGASGGPSPGASGGPGASPSPGASPTVKSEARIVVFGSSQMVSGMFFPQLGNGDMAMNAVSWLAERNEQISINRPEVKRLPLNLDPTQKSRLDWFSILYWPVIVALFGVFVNTLNKRR